MVLLTLGGPFGGTRRERGVESITGGKTEGLFDVTSSGRVRQEDDTDSFT